MKSIDWMSQNNNRALALEKLIELCSRVNLEYEYTEKEFIIRLPSVEELPIGTPSKPRKTFDISKWGDTGVSEDQAELPLTDTPLVEGEPPDETEEIIWCPSCREGHIEGDHRE